MMKKLTIFVSLLFLVSSVYAVAADGADFKPTIQAGDTTLTLNGTGVRNKFFIDVYACGLYLKEKSNDAAKVINADEPMALRIVVLSGLMTAEKMIKAYEEGFENSTGNNVAPIKSQIELFIQGHKGEFNKQDIVDISYNPAVGTTVTKSGKVTATIPGLEFKKAVFGIWLCDKPAQEDLKEGLLGK